MEIEQANIELQQRLDILLDATPTMIEFNGKEVGVPWLRHYCQRRFTHEFLKGDDNTFRMLCKLASYILLGRMWKIRLLHWAKWRWMYYVDNPTYPDLTRLLLESKKKIPTEHSLLCTTLATGMTDTMMTMTVKETKREAILREQRMAQAIASQKSSPSSSSGDSESEPMTTGTDTQ